MSKKIVIIGGGLGGLFTGAILAKEGFTVTILEKNATAGGGLQTFRRFGMDFDTGMHVIGGMQQGGNIRRLCDYLGITSSIQIRDVDDDCADELFYIEDKTIYKIGKGKEGFVNHLLSFFPESKEELVNYVSAIYNISGSIDLFNLRPSDGMLKPLPPDALLSADAFIGKYISNEKLRSVLAYMNPLYGGVAGKTPAFVHALISTLYIKGESRFVDGSSKMADALVDMIKSKGGTVHLGDGVRKIYVENQYVKKVVTEKGAEYDADYYISDIHPCTLFNMIEGKAFTRAYLDRVEGIPESYSAFSLYIKMKPDSFPYINHSVYITTNYSDVWDCGKSDGVWPKGILFMTPPVSNQGDYSDKVLITAPMNFDMAKAWENTRTGHRGAEYEQWKTKMAGQVLNMVEYRFPGFKDKIELLNTSSPLTIRDFYGTPHGSISGFSRDCNNLLQSNMQVVTKVRNLLLTGQNINLHGFCGVPLTAIQTCEAILGQNYLLNKLNSQCD